MILTDAECSTYLGPEPVTSQDCVQVLEVWLEMQKDSKKESSTPRKEAWGIADGSARDRQVM